MALPRIPHDPPKAIALQRVLELPERITSKIMANEEGLAPGQPQRFPLEP
jgi:hypothetical protein